MTRRDHLILAEIGAALIAALTLLGSVLDTSPHTWVTAVWALAWATVALAALFLIAGALTAGGIVGGRAVRCLLRHTVRREQMTRRRSGGSVRRRHSPTAAVMVAADRDVLFDEYADEFLAAANWASKAAA